MSTAIRQVDAAVVRPLRHEVLRRGRPVEESRYPVDDLDGTVHLAAIDDGIVIGCATLFPEAYHGAPAWRLRGMAVAADRRGRGVGARLLDEVVAVVTRHGGQVLWCNGRTAALDFYRRHGFEVVGGEFLAAGGVPHHVAVLHLTSSRETQRESAS